MRALQLSQSRLSLLFSSNFLSAFFTRLSPGSRRPPHGSPFSRRGRARDSGGNRCGKRILSPPAFSGLPGTTASHATRSPKRFMRPWLGDGPHGRKNSLRLFFYCSAIKKQLISNGPVSHRCAATETDGRKNSLRLFFYCSAIKNNHFKWPRFSPLRGNRNAWP